MASFRTSRRHLREVLAPLLRPIGVEIDVTVVWPGYVPGGAGILQITVTPGERGLIGLTLVDPGQARQVHGGLGTANLACDTERVHVGKTRHPGANLTIWAESLVAAGRRRISVLWTGRPSGIVRSR